MSARAPIDADLLAYLRVAWPAVTDGERVGDNEAPADVAGPYVILYGIEGGTFHPNADGTFDATFIYQPTSLGQRRDQVSALRDVVEEAMLAYRHRVIGGQRVSMVEPDGSPRAPYEDGRLWRSADRYRVQVVPA